MCRNRESDRGGLKTPTDVGTTKETKMSKEEKNFSSRSISNISSQSFMFQISREHSFYGTI